MTVVCYYRMMTCNEWIHRLDNMVNCKCHRPSECEWIVPGTLTFQDGTKR